MLLRRLVGVFNRQEKAECNDILLDNFVRHTVAEFLLVPDPLPLDPYQP